MAFHIPELQILLGLLKMNKYGRKAELLQRSLQAISRGIPKPIMDEIRDLYRCWLLFCLILLFVWNKFVIMHLESLWWFSCTFFCVTYQIMTFSQWVQTGCARSCCPPCGRPNAMAWSDTWHQQYSAGSHISTSYGCRIRVDVNLLAILTLDRPFTLIHGKSRVVPVVQMKFGKWLGLSIFMTIIHGRLSPNIYNTSKRTLKYHNLITHDTRFSSYKLDLKSLQICSFDKLHIIALKIIRLWLYLFRTSSRVSQQ